MNASDFIRNRLLAEGFSLELSRDYAELLMNSYLDEDNACRVSSLFKNQEYFDFEKRPDSIDVYAAMRRFSGLFAAPDPSDRVLNAEQPGLSRGVRRMLKEMGRKKNRGKTLFDPLIDAQCKTNALLIFNEDTYLAKSPSGQMAQDLDRAIDCLMAAKKMAAKKNQAFSPDQEKEVIIGLGRAAGACRAALSRVLLAFDSEGFNKKAEPVDDHARAVACIIAMVITYIVLVLTMESPLFLALGDSYFKLLFLSLGIPAAAFTASYAIVRLIQLPFISTASRKKLDLIARETASCARSHLCSVDPDLFSSAGRYRIPDPKPASTADPGDDPLADCGNPDNDPFFFNPDFAVV